MPILAGWLYWGWRLARAEWFARDIRKGLRVLSRDPSALRWELLWFKPSELGGQPLPHGVRDWAPRSVTSCSASSRASCTRSATRGSSS